MSPAALGLPFDDRTLWLVTVVSLGVFVAAVALTVAAVLLRMWNNRKAERWAAAERAWELTVLDVLAEAQPPEALHRLVTPRDHRYFVGYLERYARRLAGDERLTVARLAERYLASIVPDLQHRRLERRARAVQTLGAFAAQTHREALHRALHDPAPFVAMLAAHAIASLEEPDDAVALIRALDRFRLWNARILVAMLVRLGTGALPALREALAAPDLPPRSRAVVAGVLLELSDAPSADAAAHVLREAADPDLLIATLNLIARIGTDAQIPAVRPFLDAPDAAVRAKAVATLSEIGGQDELEAVRSALRDPNPWVVLGAARGLLSLGRQDLLEELSREQDASGEAAREVLMEVAR